MKKVQAMLILLVVVNFLFGINAIAPNAGDGSSGNPYQISSLENLYWVKMNAGTWDKYFIQTADIDASASSAMNAGAGWKPIGPFPSDSLFTGHYDGQGYKIDGLYANRPSTNYMGLFGEIWNSNSEIKNIHMTNVDITGQNYVGAIVGVGYMKMNNCSSSGSVSGNQRVGGIAGTVANSSPMNNCYSTASVSGSYYSGGLVGSNEATMQKCYSTGTITGGNYTGGLVGFNQSSINNSYFTGTISGDSYIGGLAGINESDIDNSYFAGSISGTSNVGGLVGESDDMMGFPSADKCVWNSDTISTGIASGWNSGTNYSKTTAEMTTQTTYTAIGWDFTSIWSMDADTNNNYPYLPGNPPSETALPICLKEFKAVESNGCVELSWKTESETNNAYFLIIRNDEVIARIDGAGTSSEANAYSYKDNNVIPGQMYTYTLADISYANERVVHDDFCLTITIGESSLPQTHALENNYPNPFNPFTKISFALSDEENVCLDIFDTNGKRIRNLINGVRPAGYYKVIWNGRDNRGVEVKSGMYICRITAGNFSDSQKMLLVK